MKLQLEVMMGKPDFDLCVIGAGSGGFAAALSAARLGLHVILVEKQDWLGGNAVHSGVNNWEMGVGGTGISFDLYQAMQNIPAAVGITSLHRHILFPEPNQLTFPGGEWVIDPQRSYIDTLKRHGTRGFKDDRTILRERWHAVVFEPKACDAVMRQMLQATGRCEIRTGTTFTDLQVHSRRITSIDLDDGKRISASIVVDATADVLLLQRAQHPLIIGRDCRDDFNEPDAPSRRTDQINGVTLIYRITPRNTSRVDPLDPEIPTECWWAKRYPVASFTQYPNGDFNVNMLPTMDGHQARAMEYKPAYAECRRRVLSHWHHLHCDHEEFQAYEMSWIAPTLGVREGPRMIGRYVLTQNDLIQGIGQQRHDDVVALADHAMDVHGSDAGESRCPELPHPYGVPYRCLQPRDLDNVLVACRGASFSAIAASSCRLSRTMMQLGQAAGTAAAISVQSGQPLAQVAPIDLQHALRQQHVLLDWPMPDHLKKHLISEASHDAIKSM